MPRPRISILTALLLMTILGMGIVVVRQWREISPLRAENELLRNETGRLSIEDPTKIHAIEVRTGEALLWKWRVWNPEGQTLIVRAHWGKIPSSSMPPADGSLHLKPGENWITMRAHASATGNTWSAKLESDGNGLGMSIPEADRWWQWPTTSSTENGIGFRTKVFDDDDRYFVLKRFRVTSINNRGIVSNPSTPTTGFIIWLERR
jgi:hypothetical protein